MTFAPAAIAQLSSKLDDRDDKPKSYAFLGIVGDSQHSFGYHLSPRQLKSNGLADDYSLQLPRDKAGASNFPDDASAWDLGYDAEEMKLVTSRLVAAAAAKDPRMSAVREFAGTTNGVNPHPFDLSQDFDDPDNTMEWDDSHLTHIHVSFYRDVSNDFDALSGVLDVICGVSAEPVTDETLEDDMAEMLVLNKDKTAQPLHYLNGSVAVISDKQRKGLQLLIPVKKLADADYQLVRALAKK